MIYLLGGGRFKYVVQCSPLKLGKMHPFFTICSKGLVKKPPTSLPLFTSPKSTIHGLVNIQNIDPVRNDVILFVSSQVVISHLCQTWSGKRRSPQMWSPVPWRSMV